MEVVEDGQSRLACALRVDQATDQLEQPPLPRLDVHSLDRTVGVGDAEEVEEERRLIGEALVQPP